MKQEFEKKYIDLEKNNWWFVSRRELIKNLIEDNIGKKGKIVDIGCGPGENLKFFNNYDIIGIDNSDEFINYAKKDNIKILKSKFPKTPFKKNNFDAALCLDLLEHIDDDYEGIKEIYRILKPQGIAVITVPANPYLWSYHDEINLHKR